MADVLEKKEEAKELLIDKQQSLFSVKKTENY